MSRKDGSYQSFQQLYDYITRDNGCDHAYNFTQNFILADRESILDEFHRNAQLLRKRKNGNYLYHEIISFTRGKQLSEKEQKKIIRETCIRFANERANNCLVFGGLHTDKDNQLHMHLMISANQLNQTKRHSISTKQYDTCKRNAESYILERHPEMEQAKLMSKPRTYRDDKEQLKEAIQKELETAQTIDEFYSNLKEAGFSYKVRGRTHSFVVEKTGKAHRIKTLGFEAEYFNFLMNHGGKIKADPQPRKRNPKPDYSQAKGKVDSVAKTAGEWVAGDFSQRDKEATKEKFKKQNEFDKSVKSREQQTTFENATETASEWITGDFKKREARERNKKSEERLKQYRKKQNPKPHVKDKEDMTKFERFTEITDEWVFGDFSARDSRQAKNRREQLKKARRNLKKDDKGKDKTR